MSCFFGASTPKSKWTCMYNNCRLIVYIPSLKLTASLPLKIDGWKTISVLFGGKRPIFRGELLVLGRVDYIIDYTIFHVIYQHIPYPPT